MTEAKRELARLDRKLGRMVSQSRKGSLTEALINVAIGFSINYCANLLVFPLFGMHISMTDNVLLGAIYTVISIVRSYVIRRWFNGYIVSAAKRVSKA